MDDILVPKIGEQKIADAEAMAYFMGCMQEVDKKEYLKAVVPGTGKTVSQLTAVLTRDYEWMKRAFMWGKAVITQEIINECTGRLARHLHEQCVVLEVPYYLFREGCVFFNQGMTAKYHSVWAISALRQQAMKRGHPLIANDFKVRYDIPRIQEILSAQEAYLKDMMGGKNHGEYASMSLRDVMGEERTGCFRFKRCELVILGAEVTFYIEGTQQNPVYFGVDLSKTSFGKDRPYGLYQQQVVRTKAIRHAMQTYYGPILPELITTDEAACGDITGNEDPVSAMRHYNLDSAADACSVVNNLMANNYKTKRQADFLRAAS